MTDNYALYRAAAYNPTTGDIVFDNLLTAKSSQSARDKAIQLIVSGDASINLDTITVVVVPLG